MKRILRWFPQADKRNIAIYYVIVGLTSCWFVEGNWFFFWTRFMSVTQVGLIFTISTILGLLLEIPTGAVADHFGRKKTTALGLVLQAWGILAFSQSQNFWQLVVADLFFVLGTAFLSGSLEALAYDSLKSEGIEESYKKVISKSNQISIIVGAITIIVGGLMYVWYFRLPHLAWGMTMLLGFLLSLGLKEEKGDKSENYLANLKDGMRYFFTPELRPYIILIMVLMGVFYIYDWGLMKPAMAISFGFFDREQAVVYTIFAIVCTLVVGKFSAVKEKFKNNLQGVRIVTLLMAIGFLLGSFKLGWLGFGVLIIIEIAGTLAGPWISVVVNEAVPSKHRATTLSGVAFLTKIPYILSMLIISRAVDGGMIRQVSLVIGIMIIAFMLVGRWYESKKLHSL